MELKKIDIDEYIESIDAITHIEDPIPSSNNSEFKVLETRFITDGELSDTTDDELIPMNTYPLEDGYIIEDIDYIRKNKISFKNYTYIFAYCLVYKKSNNNLYIDIINIRAYLKDINDMITLNKVRRISKSLKRTFYKMNSPYFSIRKTVIPETIDESKLEDLSANVYKLKNE